MPTSFVRSPLLATAACFGLFLASESLAQTGVSTAPIGLVSISLPADSDTYVNLTLKRRPEFFGTASAIAGGKITLTDVQDLVGSQFVHSAAQRKHYYLLVAGGPKAGAFCTITANDRTSITVDLAGGSLDSALTFGTSGTPLQVIPYDSLGSIFPQGQSVVGSTSHSFSARQTEILIPDQQTAGTDLSAAAVYYYYSGSAGAGAGWRKDGATGAIADDDILYPDNFFIVRTKSGQAGRLNLLGGVQMCSLQAPLSTLAANKSQDNPVALPVAATLTLKQTNLVESGAFTGSASHGFNARRDELLVFDNAVLGHDKSASRVYYYYTGANPGWRLDGDTRTVRDGEVVVSPNTALVVRKKASASAGTVFWSVKPPYVP